MDKTLHSIVHAVIRLEQLARDYGPERRRLIILKQRGQAFRGGYHDLIIKTGGLSVFPRCVASEHHTSFNRDLLCSGIKELDALLGGGGERGSSTLIMGPSGTGKSTFGRDATVLQQLLQEANIPCSRCKSIADLAARLSDKTTFAIITEEALTSADLEAIAGWIGAQPSWSDLPIIILTKRADGTERNPVTSRLVSIFGNVSFLERPFHPTTLVSLASTALRGRLRQYQTRAHLEELERRREELRESEERLSSILERVPVGVGFFDTAGRFLLRNPAIQDFVRDVIPSRDKPERWRAFDETGRQLEPSEYPGARALRGEVIFGAIQRSMDCPQQFETSVRQAARRSTRAAVQSRISRKADFIPRNSVAISRRLAIASAV
jgi:PAS domain-containing protein